MKPDERPKDADNIHEWKKHSHGENDCNDPLFYIGALAKSFQMEVVVDDQLWVFHNFKPDEDDGCWMSFGFFNFHSEDEDGIELCHLMSGCGPTGALKECRHTYWGEKGDGYIFYPNAKHIKAALDWLSKYYEMS